MQSVCTAAKDEELSIFCQALKGPIAFYSTPIHLGTGIRVVLNHRCVAFRSSANHLASRSGYIKTDEQFVSSCTYTAGITTPFAKVNSFTFYAPFAYVKK